MPQTTPKNFGKAVKVIYGLFSPEQQELMRISFDSMTRCV